MHEKRYELHLIIDADIVRLSTPNRPGAAHKHDAAPEWLKDLALACLQEDAKLCTGLQECFCEK